MRVFLLAAGLGLALAAPAVAADTSITISHAWARATAASAMTGGAFLTLTAKGGADTLVGASTPVAKTAELHRTADQNGVMKMLPVPKLALPAGQAVTFKPGGYHIMLMGLKHPLKRGESFPLTLRFEHAAPQTVSVAVEGPGAMAPMMHMKH
jgi:copper(I)-binding protein